MTESVVPAEPDPDLLAVYLNDHLAGSAGGRSLARRLAKNHDGVVGAQLGSIAKEIDADRQALLAMMKRAGVRRNPTKQVMARIGELVARLKLNGRMLRRSPLSSVLELEMLFVGVQAKAAGWRTLRQLADSVPALRSAELDHLQQRARDQGDRLEALRLQAVTEALEQRNAR